MRTSASGRHERAGLGHCGGAAIVFIFVTILLDTLALGIVIVLYAGYRHGSSAKTVRPAVALVGICSGVAQGGAIGPNRAG